MNLVAPKLETVRVGLIGVGERGTGFVHHFCNIEGARVTAICDTHQLVLDRAAGIMSDYGEPAPALYTGDDYSYRGLLERQDVDIAVIATPWLWHAIMAAEAMESGKHAFVEVPAVTTVEEAWQMKEIDYKNSMSSPAARCGRERVIRAKVAGGEGFEPPLAESESAVLPLDDPPVVPVPANPDYSTWNAGSVVQC